MFTGLSAFPLTPIINDQVDGAAFGARIDRLADARVDSITVLGSTGSYAYLSRQERSVVATIGVERSRGIPTVVGILALRTGHVLQLAEDAQTAGAAAAVLLAPMSYQQLTDDDVYGLYEDVTRELSVPLIVYDNPGTTHVTFTDELYQAIAALPRVASIKIPRVPADPAEAEGRIQHLRAILPPSVTIGVSGDNMAVTGLNAGCDAWYSVIGGTLPEPALAITRAAQSGDPTRAAALSDRLDPLWDLFARHGSLRVVACIAEQLGYTTRPCLPAPIRGLEDNDRADVLQVVDSSSAEGMTAGLTEGQPSGPGRGRSVCPAAPLRKDSPPLNRCCYR